MPISVIEDVAVKNQTPYSRESYILEDERQLINKKIDNSNILGGDKYSAEKIK